MNDYTLDGVIYRQFYLMALYTDSFTDTPQLFMETFIDNINVEYFAN